MIRAVIDTNVLASGLISERAAPGMVMTCWAAGLFELAVSDHILAELARTLNKPYVRDATWADWAVTQVARLRDLALLVTVTTRVEGVATHPEDDLVLATAVDARADCPVTGDRGLQAVQRYREVVLLSPAAFVLLLADGADRWD